LLLRAAGFEPDIRAPDVFESVLKDEPATETVLRLAQLKADAVERRGDEVVLAADTMVVLDHVPLGKPSNSEDAQRMLRALSGETHSVLTGWVVIADSGERFGVAETWVTFRELTDDAIEQYVDDAQPFDKAGAYAIQGEDGRLIEQVSGSRANVMGLPLREIVDAIEEFGIERSTPHS